MTPKKLAAWLRTSVRRPTDIIISGRDEYNPFALVDDLLADRDFQEHRAVQAEQLGGGDFELRALQALGEWPGGNWPESVSGIGARIVKLEAEVRRLRSRVRVEAADVPAIPPSRVIDYLVMRGWVSIHRVERDDGPLWMVMSKGDRYLDVPMLETATDYQRVVASFINDLAAIEGKTGLDLLDEMAATNDNSVTSS